MSLIFFGKKAQCQGFIIIFPPKNDKMAMKGALMLLGSHHIPSRFEVFMGATFKTAGH
jgi:hypothetical protein